MTTATMTKSKKTRVTKKRFRLLAGVFQTRADDGTMGAGIGVIYHANGDGAGNIIETTDDLCQRFNGPGRRPKFERLDTTLQGGQVWNPDIETIDQFVARMEAETAEDAADTAEPQRQQAENKGSSSGNNAPQGRRSGANGLTVRSLAGR